MTVIVVHSALLSGGEKLVVSDECECAVSSGRTASARNSPKRARSRRGSEATAGGRKKSAGVDEFEPDLISFEEGCGDGDGEAVCDAAEEAAELEERRRRVADMQRTVVLPETQELEQQWVRRLRFYSKEEGKGSEPPGPASSILMSGHLQSEMPWIGARERLDPSVLSFGYHRTMIQAMQLAHVAVSPRTPIVHATSESKATGPSDGSNLGGVLGCSPGHRLGRIGCLGLGGGCLPRYLLSHYPAGSVVIEAVELEQAVVEAAASSFGCVGASGGEVTGGKTSSQGGLMIRTGDAMAVVQEWSQEVREDGRTRFDAILIDVNASNEEARETGVSAPPANLLGAPFLEALALILVPDSGVAVWNFLPEEGRGGIEAVEKAIQRLREKWFEPGARVMPAGGEGESNTVVAGRAKVAAGIH